jgi:hypothetical protein
MAAHTKEQRAARDAPKETQQEDVGGSDGLIPVAKNGETLRVHPVALKQHQALGWKVVE